MTSDECFIHSIGTATPEQSLGLDEWIALLKQGYLNSRSARLFERLARLAGVERRHFAALDYMDEVPLYRPAHEQPKGPGMAERTALFDRAAARLIARLLDELPQNELARVGTLVTATCTQAASPGLEQPILMSGLVPLSAQRWNLGFMGCSAALAALRLVHKLDVGDQAALVVACELSSLHFQYSDQIDQVTANVLFADGAAAFIVSNKPSSVRVVDCRCVTLPRAADQMVWFAGDHGLELRLSPALPETLASSLADVVDQFLAENGVQRNDIEHWLVHPGGPQILDSVEQCLELGRDALSLSRSVLRRFGNMSSPTIVFILKDLVQSGGHCKTMAIAFGPGLTIELVLLDVESM